LEKKKNNPPPPPNKKKKKKKKTRSTERKTKYKHKRKKSRKKRYKARSTWLFVVVFYSFCLLLFFNMYIFLFFLAGGEKVVKCGGVFVSYEYKFIGFDSQRVENNLIWMWTRYLVLNYETYPAKEALIITLLRTCFIPKTEKAYLACSSVYWTQMNIYFNFFVATMWTNIDSS